MKKSANKKLAANLNKAADYLEQGPLRCPSSAFTGLFFVLADDGVTYHRALRTMAKEIDPVASTIVSQRTLIISRWFATHDQTEQIALLRRLAKSSIPTRA